MNAHLYGIVRPDALDKLRATAEEIARTRDVRRFYEDVPKPVPQREQTLLDLYATEEEITAVRAAHAEIAVAGEAVQKITAALSSVRDHIAASYRSATMDTERAAAQALGEAVEQSPPQPTVASSSHLQAQKIGLERRAEQARTYVEECRGKFRAAVHDLVRTCAMRCADDYDKATRTQAWCHQQLHIAQQLTGTSTQRLVDDSVWNAYSVPGSDHIPVLKRNSRSEWGRPVRMSADRLSLSAPVALKALRAHGKELFGDWPL